MIPMAVIEGGRGTIYGTLTETDQTQIPAYTFVNPRRIMRTNPASALRAGMVLRSPSGEVFIVGENGPSDAPGGMLWQSWRLFEATAQVTWQRRTSIIDAVTQLPREGQLQDMGMIWALIEPTDRETPDLTMRVSHEQDRLLCGAAIQHDDLVNGKKVIRADLVLGVRLGTLND
jgi:hypothetical protein